MNVTTVGIDLAKNVLSVHGVDIHGKVVIRKTVSRGKLLECFANLPPRDHRHGSMTRGQTGCKSLFNSMADKAD